MDKYKTISEFRGYRHDAAEKKIVFVPTMGALHEGHGSLVRMARSMAGEQGLVAVSIFVNPTQFGPNEDFHKYPRPFEQDATHLEKWGADVIFAPDAEEMYASDESIMVDPGPLGEVLEGAIRPGHFKGVCTVVAKLLGIVQPEVMILGQKDFQQQVILRRMAVDLKMPVEVITAPTMREADGLAMSSRNRYLSVDERSRAGAIYAALCEARDQYQSGNRDAAALESGIREGMLQAGMDVQYALACHTEMLTPCNGMVELPCVLLMAAKLGATRLIDNIVL